MPTKIGAKIIITKDGLPALVKSIRLLADTHVMVGIPWESAPRDDPSEKITNAEIGYVQENGAPEANLPPRPHLFPTVRDNRAFIAGKLRVAGVAALSGEHDKMEKTLEGLGLTMVARIRQRIRSVIPPPLAPATVARRIARRKSPSWRRKRHALIAANIAAGHQITDVTGATQTATDLAPGVGVFTPLIDTSNYINHLTYVLRSKKNGVDKVGPSK